MSEISADDLILAIELQNSMRPVLGNWKDWFAAVRHNYRLYSAAVERGEASWGYPCDPYVIADWASLLTPIEAAVWSDIRECGAPFWPQFPAGRFVLDFADPVRKIGLECDGAAFHDIERDYKRDEELRQAGWRVYRASGRQCMAERVVFRDWLGGEFDLFESRARRNQDSYQG